MGSATFGGGGGVQRSSDNQTPHDPGSAPLEIRLAGDSAVVVDFEHRVDPLINTRAVAMAEAVRHDRHRGVRDVVSSYCSVTVFFDPLRTDLDCLIAALQRHGGGDLPAAGVEPTPIVVPVCYGGEFGPDLDEVARFGDCSTEEVVRRHAEPVYRVYLLGFIPGFAYMGRVDECIAIPRRQTPRLRVPAGTVGVAGAQTGIYPVASPGGWRLIGRTFLRPFDPDRAQAFAFKPGDAVKFHPIDRAAYREQAAELIPR